MANDLFYYLKQVQRRAGLNVSSAFPSSNTDEEALALDTINEILRHLNNKYHFIFQQTEYTLTTTAGTRAYNLASAPYSQTYWRVNRLAKNGVIRSTDETPLTYVQYTELDWRKPRSANQAASRYYSQYGKDLILYPTPDGGDYIIRYHGVHIGTDDTGATQKLELTETDDLVILEDEWADVLITGAAAHARAQRKVDEKQQRLEKKYEEYTKTLKAMANQPGDDAVPEHRSGRYVYGGDYIEERFHPFGTDFAGQ